MLAFFQSVWRLVSVKFLNFSEVFAQVFQSFTENSLRTVWNIPEFSFCLRGESIHSICVSGIHTLKFCLEGSNIRVSVTDDTTLWYFQ